LSTYFIGDVQGCCDQLERLLEKVLAQDADAHFLFAGDLVNRGPTSLATLRLVKSLGQRANSVLGNHDLHWLAVSQGIRPKHAGDTLDELLQAPDSEELLAWLRHRPLAIALQGHVLVHAGVYPQWSTALTEQLAAEIETALRGDDWCNLLKQMYGNTPAAWSNQLQGTDRQRAIINAFTRMRYCLADGSMDFKNKEGGKTATKDLIPWFDLPQRQTEDTVMVFGHWSTLGLVLRPNLISLDTGCVWGGQLSAVSLCQNPSARRVIQVDCPQQQTPG
jgi:bis(5'-nucleosyl)-tetraphosphatase (symmetrical)